MPTLQTALSEYLQFLLYYGIPILLIFSAFVYLLSRQRHKRIAHKIAQKDAILAQQCNQFNNQNQLIKNE